MGIEDIEKKILAEAETEAQKIEAEGLKEQEKFKDYLAKRIKDTQNQILFEAKAKAEEIQKSILVPVRLKARNELLKEKQIIMERLYQQVQKEKNISEIELKELRENTEVEVCKILFS